MIKITKCSKYQNGRSKYQKWAFKIPKDKFKIPNFGIMNVWYFEIWYFELDPRKHDLTNRKTMTKTMTNTFKEHIQRAIFET